MEATHSSSEEPLAEHNCGFQTSVTFSQKVTFLTLVLAKNVTYSHSFLLIGDIVL